MSWSKGLLASTSCDILCASRTLKERKSPRTELEVVSTSAFYLIVQNLWHLCCCVLLGDENMLKLSQITIPMLLYILCLEDI